MKKWSIAKNDTEKVSQILKKTDLSRLCAEVLVARGITEIDMLSDFFSEQDLSDPFLLKDMYEATEIITEAIENGLSICIYGDYDCDGVTSTAILYNYLECAGGNVSFFIPEREEGYGLNEKAIHKLSEQGVELIITVDNGISAISEAELIEQLGIKLVITDHHQPPEILPKALAIVNPHRKDCTSPFKNLAGVGVVMKLIMALDEGNCETILDQYADIAAIGTIADIVPLIGENRTIVKRGLKQLTVTENYGLTALMEKSGLSVNKISSTGIAFLLAPRINAAGRFASASIAVNALLSEDDEAEALVDQLNSLNNERKAVEEKILIEIKQYISDNPQLLNERVLVLTGENWHHGVIGIVCAKLLELYGKPNILISIDGNSARGSARSFKGFNMYNCLRNSSDLLLRFGGHEAAGGLSIDINNIAKFKESVAEFSRLNYPNMPNITITADKILKGEDFKVELVEGLKLLEPFGEGNSQPLFAILGAKVDKINSLSNAKHTKLDISYDGIKVQALMFGVNPSSLFISLGDVIDLLVYMEINEYNGNKTITLRVRDYRKSGFSQDKYFSAKACYEGYKRGDGVSEKLKPRIIPTREEMVGVFKYLLNEKTPQSIDKIFMKLSSEMMNYCKLRICLDIFEEINLISINASTDTISVNPINKKADLESSRILSELRNI